MYILCVERSLCVTELPFDLYAIWTSNYLYRHSPPPPSLPPPLPLPTPPYVYRDQRQTDTGSDHGSGGVCPGVAGRSSGSGVHVLQNVSASLLTRQCDPVSIMHKLKYWVWSSYRWHFLFIKWWKRSSGCLVEAVSPYGSFFKLFEAA